MANNKIYWNSIRKCRCLPKLCLQIGKGLWSWAFGKLKTGTTILKRKFAINKKRYFQICLDIDRTKCPKRSVGSAPHCKCEEGYQLDNIHWYCRAWYLNDTRGGHAVGPLPQCPVFHTWDGSKCEPIRCPNNRELLFPHCTDSHVHIDYPSTCPPGQNVTIEKPYVIS